MTPKKHQHLTCALIPVGLILVLWTASGSTCTVMPPEASPPGLSIYNNMTDKTNRGADFIGGDACRACHSSIASAAHLHAHNYSLTPITGSAPVFPAGGGVPNPPAGFSWSDISYVLGGYTKGAIFFDRDGFALSTGLTGQNTLWQLGFPPNGSTPTFAPYEPGAVAPIPFDYQSFAHVTTGPVPQDPANPMFQENRPGFLGTWNEAGAQCESCHGPGSNHIPNRAARDLFVDPTGAQSCAQCHSRPFDSTSSTIAAAGGFIKSRSQWQELQASVGHAAFSCTFCHDPHRGTTYDRPQAIRNECTACHSEMNMALHRGTVFVRPTDGYTETMTCESCHMPFAVRALTSADPSNVGPVARVGDTRSHIFRITTEPIDYTGFFTPDSSQVKLAPDGSAALTVDFVCLRCHNSVSLPTLTFSVERAAEIAIGVHQPPQP